jgi:hypothetical protein
MDGEAQQPNPQRLGPTPKTRQPLQRCQQHTLQENTAPFIIYSIVVGPEQPKQHLLNLSRVTLIEDRAGSAMPLTKRNQKRFVSPEEGRRIHDPTALRG